MFCVEMESCRRRVIQAEKGDIVVEMNLNLLSKYIKELFGVCILGVLAGHALPNMEAYHNTFLYYFIKMFSLIGVRGFVFLSGFGLYYSLKKSAMGGGEKQIICLFIYAFGLFSICSAILYEQIIL